MQQTIAEMIETLEEKLRPGGTSPEIEDAANQLVEAIEPAPFLSEAEKQALSRCVNSHESDPINTEAWSKLKRFCGT